MTGERSFIDNQEATEGSVRKHIALSGDTAEGAREKEERKECLPTINE
jgi:hypothetical protein